MPQTKRVESLEINQDLSFQQKEWKVERAGWVIMAVIILLALVGLFGGGPVSSVSERASDGFELTHERFDRQMNPSQLKLQLPPEAVQEGEVKFWIEREYLEKIQIEDVSPPPDRVEVSAEQMIYTVKVADASQPVVVKMDIRLEETGLIEGQVGLEGGDTISFSTLVFP